MEPRIQYAQTADGVSIAFSTQSFDRLSEQSIGVRRADRAGS